MPDQVTRKSGWLPQMLLPSVACKAAVTGGTAYRLVAGNNNTSHDSAPRALWIQADNPEASRTATGRIGVVEKTLFEDFVTYDDDVIESRAPAEAPAGESPSPPGPVVTFLPADAIWHYGIDKPGAVLLHRIRRVDTTVEGGVAPGPRTSQARPVEAAIRAPQVFAPPSDATLRVTKAKSANGTDGLSALEIEWIESCGSVPIGPLDGSVTANDSNLLKGEAGLPPLALVQQVGDRLIPLSLEAPRLLLPKPAPNGHTESMSLYVVCKWDLLKYPGDDANAVTNLLLGDGNSPLRLEAKNARIVFQPQPPAADETRVYELPATLFTKDGIPYTSWNIEWTKVGPPSCKLFSAASPITPTSADTTEPPRVAAVLRATGNPGLLGTNLDRTLFYGAAASTRSFSPSLQPANNSAPARFVLDAHGSETVKASKALLAAAEGGTITLVKYFRDGSTLAAIRSVDDQP